MLQKYDKVKPTSLLALAAAGGLLFAQAAAADNAVCDATNGYEANLAEYVAEATTCIEQSTQLATDVEASLASQLSTARDALGLAALDRRTSLDQAARAHALDMASRDYASHSDLEGRDHLYRIRAFDRSMLVGATGANVMATKSDADATALFTAMGQDVQNAQNIVFEGFTDFGVGVAEADGTTYTVVLFASREGELEEALPLTLDGSAAITAQFTRDLSEAVGWSLSDLGSGEQFARGTMLRIRDARLSEVETASLDIKVSEQADTYTVKGPLISAR